MPQQLLRDARIAAVEITIPIQDRSRRPPASLALVANTARQVRPHVRFARQGGTVPQQLLRDARSAAVDITIPLQDQRHPTPVKAVVVASMVDQLRRLVLLYAFFALLDKRALLIFRIVSTLKQSQCFLST